MILWLAVKDISTALYFKYAAFLIQGEKKRGQSIFIACDLFTAAEREEYRQASRQFPTSGFVEIVLVRIVMSKLAESRSAALVL